MNAETIAERLRDIRDLDPAPWWPPGPGWWLVAIGLLALFALLWRYPPRIRLRRPQRRARWQRTAARELRQLRRRIRQDDAKQLAGELSELLRRIAMARCGRASCAGLTGSEWLEWLRHHDPSGYDWTRHGRVLATAPYAPPGHAGNPAMLQELVNAALAWTRGSAGPCTGKAAEHVV